MIYLIVSNVPDHTTAIAKIVIIHPHIKGLRGISECANTPAIEAKLPMAMAPTRNIQTSTIHTAQFFFPGILLNISIIPSPVHAVYRAPPNPIHAFKAIPITIAHSAECPKIAPTRVARITSPDPIYSAHQTNAGPTNARMANPFGAFAIVVFFSILNSL